MPNGPHRYLASDPDARDHWVYKCYSEDRRLLYVGITWQALHRQSEHRVSSSWSREVHTIEVEHFDSREESLARERHLIQTLRPENNRLGALPALEEDEWTVRELAAHFALSVTFFYNEIKSGALRAEDKRCVGQKTIKVVRWDAVQEWLAAQPQTWPPRRTTAETTAA